MSGIFGIIRLPGATVADAELAPMAETLKHRGPDGINYFARENAGLGHCMLQSTPESLHEVLPMRDEAAGLTITADARIDNREQLLSDIPVRASNGQVITDSQLILHAYRKWGEGCVDHLLGDFVFAIWDERAQALFVARDHMGCKPFYYHCHNGLFVFASSAMAAARVPEVKATLNEGRVADYLVEELEGINKTCSWYNEISRMPPAQCGHFRNNSFQYRQYWTLEPADLSHLKTDEDYLEAFTEVYTEAVRCRLRCNTEPASMLSGGLDSSTIVALARDILAAEGRPPLKTYSGISEQGEDCPETQSVEAVINHGNVEATCLRPSDTDENLGQLDEALASLEDPFDASWTLIELMFLSAARDGGRMLFTGIDGEHAVGAPTNYLLYFFRERRWTSVWQEARGFSAHYWRGHHSAVSLVVKAFRQWITPNFLRKWKRKVTENCSFGKKLDKNPLSDKFASRVDLASRFSEYRETMFLSSDADLQCWHRHAMQQSYLVAAIERYERLGTYFGIEVRHALLDIRLLQYSTALPLRYKVRGGWSKYLLRVLADKRLPFSVAWREGWEEIGWKFTVRQEKSMAYGADFRPEEITQSLGNYLEAQLLEELGSLAGNTKLVADFWNYHRLDGWLRQLRNRDLEAAADN